MRNTYAIILSALMMLTAIGGSAAEPKREFRGAWLHTIYQGQYKEKTPAQLRQYLATQLDSLQAAGVNAIIFQVRPQADAFYPSELEPWSRFLTDNGAAPDPMWDPLQYMIEQTHARGMELHAWLNPYRVTSNSRQRLPQNHIYHQHPERFITYDGKLYFDPGLPENREFIGRVVDDIVARYDVDGIHFDDYFYPYPVAGKEFDDNASYARYGNGMDRGDWRRHNVDLLIEDLHNRIRAAKPWVRFGVSPFGIHRNKSTDPDGSETSGLQNYDALFADVLLWDREGWTDYVLPQLYWELNHRAASTAVLLEWWNRHAGTNRHLYIGQDVAKCIQKAELGTKIDLSRAAENVQGNCWWPGYMITRNFMGVADSLATRHQTHIALVPSYPWISTRRPAAVTNLAVDAEGNITWTPEATPEGADRSVRFVVYRFDSPENIDITRGDAIVAVTPATNYTASQPGTYVITALSRVNNESDASNPVVVR